MEFCSRIAFLSSFCFVTHAEEVIVVKLDSSNNNNNNNNNNNKKKKKKKKKKKSRLTIINAKSRLSDCGG